VFLWGSPQHRGQFNNEPTEEAALKDRIEKLERLVGKLVLGVCFGYSVHTPLLFKATPCDPLLVSQYGAKMLTFLLSEKFLWEQTMISMAVAEVASLF